MTENEKVKFQNLFTYNDQRNFVECNPVKKISDDFVYPTKSHTSSDSVFSEEREEIAEGIPAPTPTPAPAPSKEREEITEDIPAPAENIPAPAPARHTGDSRGTTSHSMNSMKKNFGRPASAYSDFYMETLS